MDPLVIQIGRQRDGCTYQLHPTSLIQIKKTFPNAQPAPRVFVGYEPQSDFETIHGPFWKQIATILTGLSWDQIRTLGGIKIYDPATEVDHEVICQGQSFQPYRSNWSNWPVVEH